MRLRAGAAGLALALAAAPPSGAEPMPPAVAWLADHSGAPRSPHLAGEYLLDGSGVVGLDPLTFFASPPTPQVPAGRADVWTLRQGDGRIALAALVLSDAAPVCGADLGSYGVDSGTAALMTETDLARLHAAERVLALLGGGIHALFGIQFPNDVFRDGMLRLPDRTALPVFSSGWGDGGYGVAVLNGADGRAIAIYTDFMGNDATGGWITPPPCDTT